MYDLRCPICGEPWELDSIHDEVSARWEDKPWAIDGKHDQTIYERDFFGPVYRSFRKDGCVALTFFTDNHNLETISPAKNSVFGALMELAGDDVDFAVSMIEDAESFGLLD